MYLNNNQKPTLKMETAAVGSSACGCAVLPFTIYLVLGTLSFDFLLSFIFGKDVPWYLDLLGGFFLGSLTIPGAVICWILQIAGVHHPLVH